MMSMTVLAAFSDALPIARYRFTATLRAGVRLPGYAGSLLRGQFGAALRQVACMTRQPTCVACPLLRTCPYTRVFEAPAPPAEHALQKFSNIPNAYVIEPPLATADLAPADLPAGDTLTFHMVLAGEAIAQLPLIVFAWQRALAQGLTRERAAADLQAVDWVDASGVGHGIWHADAPVLLEHAGVISVPPLPAKLPTAPTTTPALPARNAAAPDGFTLHIHTPLRLQHQGHPLRPAQLTPRALVAAVARRVALVMEFHAGQTQWGAYVPQLVQMADTLHDARDLHWHDWTRYSSRQQQEMTLGGVMGRWSLRGSPETLAALWPWLWLGQWLHAGKNATMGMGGYTLELA